MANWDDSTKFWRETLRTIALGVIGAVAAILLLKPWEKNIEYQAEVVRTRLNISAQVVDQFLAASYRYTAIAYDACSGDQEAIKVFQGDAIDAFRSAQNRLDVYFGSGEPLKKKMDAVRQATSKLGQLCNAGAPKNEWEPVRQSAKTANNELAVQALQSLGLAKQP